VDGRKEIVSGSIEIESPGIYGLSAIIGTGFHKL